MDLDYLLQVASKVGLALVVGIVLGLNRWLHHKSAGIRTHSLVAIGSALLMLLMESYEGFDSQAMSRVIQGLITGVGFLGAGVIIHLDRARKVHGLTTAASIWVCAILGAVIGAGRYELALIALGSVMMVLVLGGYIEKITGQLLGIERDSEVPSNEDDADLT